MSYTDLSEYMNVLEKAGELVRIAEEVDPELEITEIADRVVKMGGPALLFTRVKGSDMPVLINHYGTMGRMARALGVEDIDEIAGEIEGLVKQDMPGGIFEKLSALPKLTRLAKSFPKTVKSGSCQEVVMTGDKVNLESLPVLKCWPDDGGKFITLPMVFTKDPDTGKRNVGMYRMHVYSKNTTGMHWHIHKVGARHFAGYKKRGEKMEVAVALGGDPALTYAATAPLPEDFDEMVFAGFLRKRPVEMVKCKTVDLEVPAQAEIVLEGYVDPESSQIEGPFGDHTGYYSPADKYPVFTVTAITHKKNAIYPATIVGKPPMEDCYIGKATERIFLPLIKSQLPEIVDMNLPVEGVFHNMAFVSIKKRYPMQAHKVVSALWGLGQMSLTKMIIIFDENVNVQDTSEVLWRLGSNVDPKRDVFFAEGPVDVLDHAAPKALYGSKMGIDATRKIEGEDYDREWPEEIGMTEDVKRKVDEMWGRLGIE